MDRVRWRVKIGMMRLRYGVGLLERDKSDDPAISAVADDDLLQRIADGDRAAFAQLMERHARPMLMLAQRVLGRVEEADEIVQDSFLKVWTQAGRWQVDGGAKFSTWFYRVVLNACLDRKRRKQPVGLEEAGDPADDRPGGLDVAVARQRSRLVGAALADLPERQRAALSLFYFSGLSGREAAEVLDLSVSATEALLSRGKQALRKALARRGVTGLGDVL